MKEELSSLKESIYFLNNFITARTKSSNDCLYISDVSEIASDENALEHSFDLDDRRFKIDVARLVNLMCQDKLIRTHNKIVYVLNKRINESHIVDEEKRKIEHKIAKTHYERKRINEQTFARNVIEVKESNITEFERSELKKQRLGKTLWRFAKERNLVLDPMFPYDEHAKEYIGKWEIEPSKDEFARTMLAPGEVPQKSIFEHFISWIRS